MCVCARVCVCVRRSEEGGRREGFRGLTNTPSHTRTRPPLTELFRSARPHSVNSPVRFMRPPPVAGWLYPRVSEGGGGGEGACISRPVVGGRAGGRRRDGGGRPRMHACAAHPCSLGCPAPAPPSPRPRTSQTWWGVGEESQVGGARKCAGGRVVERGGRARGSRQRAAHARAPLAAVRVRGHAQQVPSPVVGGLRREWGGGGAWERRGCRDTLGSSSSSTPAAAAADAHKGGGGGVGVGGGGGAGGVCHAAVRVEEEGRGGARGGVGGVAHDRAHHAIVGVPPLRHVQPHLRVCGRVCEGLRACVHARGWRVGRASGRHC